MSRNAVVGTGLVAIGGVTYYLYNAGGDPKLAEKKFEHDAAAAEAKVKRSLPGREHEAKRAGEESFEAVRAKAQELGSTIAGEGRKAEAEFNKKFDAYKDDASRKLETARQETGKQLNQAVDSFDKKVSEGTGQAKGWFGGWFGGK